jgi:hypothetical protein
MKKVFCALIAASLLSIGCTNKNSLSAPTTGSIYGQVTNPAGDSLIAGAIISTSPQTIAVITDSQGNYTISNLSPGRYTITASKGIYNPGAVTITVTAGQAATADIRMAGINVVVPSAPEIDSIVADDGSVTLRFKPVTGAESYNLYYAQGTTVTLTDGTMGTAAISPEQVTGLANGVQYAFVLSAVNSAGESGLSIVRTAMPQPSQSIVAVNIAIDYSAGSVGLYSITDSTPFQNQLSIFSDNDIRTYGGAIYVLQRLGKDDIIKFSGSVIANSKVVYDQSIGAAVNIQDIAFVSPTKAYVTQYQSDQLVIIDPSSGTKSSKTIDLSAFDAYAGTDSASSFPYMSKALYYSGKVYVACQRLHAPAGGYIQAADTSCIVVINTTKDSVEGAIKLAYKDPQELSICNGKLYVASVGKYLANDGGIECIDLATGSNIGSIVDENAMQGDVGTLIVISDTKGYVVISTPTFATEMWSFNPQTKTMGMKISGIDSPCTNHFACDGTFVYVGDRSFTTPGIVIVDPATDTKVGATKNVGLPPNSLAYLKVNGY